MNEDEALERLILALERIADALDELLAVSQSCHSED